MTIETTNKYRTLSLKKPIDTASTASTENMARTVIPSRAIVAKPEKKAGTAATEKPAGNTQSLPCPHLKAKTDPQLTPDHAGDKPGKARATDPIRDMLQAAHPQTFPTKPRDTRPLAIGIHIQIKTAYPELSSAKIRQSLSRYTRQRRYLTAIMHGGHRVNLDGTKAEAITEEHKQRAREQRDAIDQRRKQQDRTAEKGPRSV